MFYLIFRELLTPFLNIIMLFNNKKSNFLKRRLKQNFQTLKNSEYIWIHCSSVGEINLSEAFIKKLLQEKKERILLTLFTDTGIEVARSKFSNNERVDIYYFPLDSRREIKKILNRINLKLLILVETEIWPNLIGLCSKTAKVIMINGRISDRSYGRYAKIKFLLKDVFDKVALFCMQSKEDKDKIISLGASEKKVVVCGNLKFDTEFQSYSEDEKQEFRKFLCIDNKKTLVAGSIRSGEYGAVVNPFLKLKDYVLIMAPRHLEKVENIEKFLNEKNLEYIKYSDLEKNKIDKKDFSVIIVDKIGILRKIYSISDVAFVGGTFVNIGGHSLLEPLFYGKTPIFGPYLQNVKEISQDILKYKIGYKVTNEEEFYDAVISVEQQQEKSQELIKKLFNDNQNVIKKILNEIEKIDSED